MAIFAAFPPAIDLETKIKNPDTNILFAERAAMSSGWDGKFTECLHPLWWTMKGRTNERGRELLRRIYVRDSVENFQP